MLAIKNPPVIPGLTFRLFQGKRDYASIAAVITASERADQNERTVSAADIAHAYQHLSNCDPLKDIIVAEVADKIIGYARGWWDDDADNARSYKLNGFLLPVWRRKGIGRVMLTWMEDHLREAAATHPPELAKYFQISVTQFQTGTESLLTRAGYQPARYFYNMVRPTLENIQDWPLPAGLEVRPVLSDHYRALWKSIDEISRDEWGYKESTEADYQQWLASPHFQPQLWQVAWDTSTDQSVGHVLTFIDPDENEQFDRKRGYTEGIGVDRAWRRRGLARALISLSLRAQKAAGMTESALAADSESTSNVTRLYESCGFQIVRRDTIYRKPL